MTENCSKWKQITGQKKKTVENWSANLGVKPWLPVVRRVHFPLGIPRLVEAGLPDENMPTGLQPLHYPANQLLNLQ